ncbi:MAG: bis-aminopropyl spermidine synthase family protein [Candidatus Heimdallarchaeota archaeon]|nr:bis-aminopropyl spermidine synthase family protein [Candidatus Heimdallarchaeota archaeon]
MTFDNHPLFLDSKLNLFDMLLKDRGSEKVLLDQKYLTKESILKRIELLNDLDLLNNHRVLAIGDADYSSTAIALFGKPHEVLVLDIDDKIADQLFDLNMEHEIPVRYLYHDIRLKSLEILKNQFTVIFMEPPHSYFGITLCLSRALVSIQDGYENNIFISVPETGAVRDHFQKIIDVMNLEIVMIFTNINKYVGSEEVLDLIRLRKTSSSISLITGHYQGPFYENEHKSSVQTYKCKCSNEILVDNISFSKIDQMVGYICKCGYGGPFQYQSQVPVI